MKISKIFHFLYFSILSVPLLSGAIFAIYSMNHEITGNEIVTSGYEVTNKYETNEVNDVQELSNDKIYKINVTSQQDFDNFFEFVSNNDFYCSYLYWVDSNYSTVIELEQDDDYLLFQIDEDDNLIVSNDDDNPRVIVVPLSDIYAVSKWSYFEQGIYVYDVHISESDYLPKEYVWNDGIVLDAPDIMSQFIYCEYNFMDKYLPMYKYAPFNGIYQWIENTFFAGSSPIVFTVIYQWFAYWLLVSLFWLIFDVLMYVPLLVHRWLDKGALE